MRVAVLSGKGGTGKTLLSVNLAAASNECTYIDCDVEEPNGHLFLKPEVVREEEVTATIPKVDKKSCNGCRKCVDFCKFNALAYIPNDLIVFEEICHSCGGCFLVCPEKALAAVVKVIGKVQKGTFNKVEIYTGILNTGEPSGIPIIKKLLSKNKSEENKLTIIDCPPGSSCAVMESIQDADYCILVAEPTLFGVHNLKMVYELVKLFDKPLGVVLNKCLEDENPSEKFCLEKNIKILGRIKFDPVLGKLNSNAEIAGIKNQKYTKVFSSLLKTILKEAFNETTTDT